MGPAPNTVNLGACSRVRRSLPLLAGIWVRLWFTMMFLVVFSHTFHGSHPLREVLVRHVRVLTGLDMQIRLNELALFVPAPHASLVHEPRVFGRSSQAELPSADVASHGGGRTSAPPNHSSRGMVSSSDPRPEVEEDVEEPRCNRGVRLRDLRDCDPEEESLPRSSFAATASCCHSW